MLNIVKSDVSTYPQVNPSILLRTLSTWIKAHQQIHPNMKKCYKYGFNGLNQTFVFCEILNLSPCLVFSHTLHS